MEAGSHFSESGGGEKQQSREVSIKDKIKIEPEMDLDPPEYISVAIKSEIPDSFEPESSCPTLPLKQTETIPPERVDVTIKTEALEGFVPELSPAPLTDKQQHEMELDPPEFINVAVKSEIPDSYEPETLTTQENEFQCGLAHWWDNMKVERIKDPEEETQDMTSIPPVTTCSEVESAAPHVDCHHGYRRAGEVVAKRRKIHVPAVTAASLSSSSTITGNCGLERVSGAGVPTSNCASVPLSHSTPSLQVSGGLFDSFPDIPRVSSTTPPDITRIQRSTCVYEAREKALLQEDEKLRREHLAEAKLNRRAAENRLRRVEELHRRSDELHRLELERLCLELRFETRQMEHRLRRQGETQCKILQAAKERHEEESRIKAQLLSARLSTLLGPSDNSGRDGDF